MSARARLFLILVLAVSTRATEIMNATDPRILWSGRRFVNHDSTNGDSVEFDWLGVSFNVGVDKGTYLKASFDMSHTGAGGHTKLRIFLTDGGYPLPANEVSLDPSMTTYLLAAGLGRSARTLSVYNNQSPSYMRSTIRLVSLETDGVFQLPQFAPTMKTRHIEFVGDSITAATNLRRPHGDPAFGIPAKGHCADGGLYSDYTLSYEAQLCEAFGANCSTVAVGGHGMYVNCCDNGPKMPEFYQLTTQNSRPAKPFDFQHAGITPDAVVINLGDNDYAGCRKFSPFPDKCGAQFAAAFAAEYVRFMINVTKWYSKPDIQFFCGVGPITNDYLNATLSAVAQAKAAGLKVEYVNMLGCPSDGKAGFTCDGCATHPGITGHRRMFEMSYHAIKSTMGW